MKTNFFFLPPRDFLGGARGGAEAEARVRVRVGGAGAEVTSLL